MYIYKITNTINNKIYIGQTIKNIEDKYIYDYTTYKNNSRAKEIVVTNNLTGETKHFHSYAAAERYFVLKPKELSSHAFRYGNEFNVKNFHIIVK